MGLNMQLSDRIGRRMKLQDLHVLMTVVQAGTMGRAAQQLNTTQPNISRSIAELEHALGVRLLDRHCRGIEPTAYGLHRLVLSKGQTPVRFGSIQGGNVTVHHLVGHRWFLESGCVSQPDLTDESPMADRKPLAHYSAMKGAFARGLLR
jgi:hypothetical protein